jgi:D-amino-acid dehydrogenase
MIGGDVTRHSDALVIGGGAIGACCAYELAQSGASVTLLERDAPPALDSGVYANAGLITPGDVFPLAAPGVLGKGLRWLLDSGSPFYVAPLAEPGLPAWLAQFAQYAREEHMRRSMPVQRTLLRQSADLFAEYAAAIGPDCHYQQLGWLMLYETPGTLADARTADLAANALGVVTEVVDGAQVAARVPGVAGSYAGGIHYAEDAHVDPAAFVRGVADLAQEKGAEVRERTEVLRLEASGDRITGVVTTRGEFSADTVVLAAGAWSPVLAKQVGLHLPVQAAKGYSVTVPRPEGVPDMPLYLTERSVVATPLGDRLRFAGTLELVGFDLSVRWKRVQRIREGGDRLFPGTARVEPLEVWRGLRPCTPDGLPIIGRSPRHANLVIATGHCMLGLGEGPITGRLVAQLAAGETPQIDLAPLRADRFLAPSRAARRSFERLAARFSPKA